MIDPTDKEQLRRYYEQALPEEIRGVLNHLTRLIGQDKDGEIYEAYSKWLFFLSHPKLLDEYFAARAAAHVPEDETWVTMVENAGYMSVEEFLSIALLGLRLIYHVDYNTDLNKNTLAAGHMVNNNSQALFDHLDAENLPQYSVHGGETYWQGEFDQAIAKTFQILGEPGDAREVLQHQLIKLADKEQVDHEQLTPAEQSAKAVILYRHGKLNRDLAESTRGVQTEVENAPRQFNRDRILDLALGTLKSALNRHEPATLANRLAALKEIASAIVYTAWRDPEETYQYFKRQRKRAS